MHPRWLRCSSLKYCPIFSVVAPCHRGASPPSVRRRDLHHGLLVAAIMDATACVSNGSSPSTSRMVHRLTATHRTSRYDTLPSEPGGGHYMIMRRALAAFALALIVCGPVWADGLPEELKARR